MQKSLVVSRVFSTFAHSIVNVQSEILGGLKYVSIEN
jgi:hypothetical protein